MLEVDWDETVPSSSPCGGDKTMLEVEPEPCNCLALRQATRRVTQLFDEALAPTGLGVNQYSILARLKGDGPSTMDGAVSRRSLPPAGLWSPEAVRFGRVRNSASRRPSARKPPRTSARSSNVLRWPTSATLN
jgi:hypothetical protein